MSASGVAMSLRTTQLPHFSESDRIKARIATTIADIQLSDHIQISHVSWFYVFLWDHEFILPQISAQFRTFAAYTTGYGSVVLMGKESATMNTSPDIIPALQNRNVISVVMGDYHCGALTATGNILTWGGFDCGALGLGHPAKIPIGHPGGYSNEQDLADALDGQPPEPPPSNEPTEVRFDHDENGSSKAFCFAVTAAGWQMGALLVELEVNLPCFYTQSTW